MAAALASYGSVLWLEVPAVTVAVSLVGRLMADRVVVGSALFALAVGATIWVRRWGSRFTIAGALATAPLLATLIIPAVPAGRTNIWWTALVAVIAYAWTLCSEGLLRDGERAEGKGARKGVSARMAAQMGVALGVAFLAGHLVLGEHWAWVVLTAFVVCSGNRGRGDVVRKSVLRIAGAAVGTAVATLLSGVFGPADPWQVVAIFVLLALGTWLRPLSYAYWAGSVTAALAFLYGYFGQSAPSLLVDRLGGILLGGVIGVAASWFVLPVRGRRSERSLRSEYRYRVTEFRAWLARACARVSRPIRRGLRQP